MLQVNFLELQNSSNLATQHSNTLCDLDSSKPTESSKRPNPLTPGPIRKARDKSSRVDPIGRPGDQNSKGASVAALRMAFPTTPEQKDAEPDLPSHSSNNSSNNRLQLTLTLDHAADEPAAVAVIAAMYGVPNAFSSLGQDQLVWTVKYADMLQMSAIAERAAQALQAAAAAAADGFSAKTLTALGQLPAWPNCLLPLLPAVAKLAEDSNSQPAAADGSSSSGSGSSIAKQRSIQRVLVTVLGDLEEVWQQQRLQTLLLELPLPAIKLLLSSDQLSVHSEDTVLYTAAKYTASLQSHQQAAAAAGLRAVVRCPQLSPFQLTAQAGNTDTAAFNILRPLQQQLHALQTFLRLEHDLLAAANAVQKHLQNTPASWKLGPRHIIPATADTAELRWRLPVSQLKQGFLKCSEQKQVMTQYSPDRLLRSGVRWALRVDYSWVEEQSGVQIGVYVHPFEHPCGGFCKLKFTVHGSSTSRSAHNAGSIPFWAGLSWGWNDFFSIGPMTGGWEQSARVSKGLPVDGDIKLVLKDLQVY